MLVEMILQDAIMMAEDVLAFCMYDMEVGGNNVTGSIRCEKRGIEYRRICKLYCLQYQRVCKDA